MKFTYGFWVALFFLGWLTAGFFPALLLTGLGVAGSISTGLSVHEKLESGGGRKMLS